MSSSFGHYEKGDRIRFMDDGVYKTGFIEQITEHQIIIKPDNNSGKLFDGYRICLSRSELAVKMITISGVEERTVNEDGSVSL